MLQPDHHVDRLAHADRLYTVQLFNVDNADAAKLQEIADHIDPLRQKLMVIDAAHLHDIIRNQTMPSLHQLQCRFTFTETAFALNQHAFTEAVHHNSVK